jgi:hypothetical protein
MFPFSVGKKKEETKKVYIPVDIVLRYSAQGLSEPDIIARLEEQGFNSDYIDKALRIALKEKVISGAPPTPMDIAEGTPLEAPAPTPFGAMENPIGPNPMGEITRRPMPMGYPPERVVQGQQDFSQQSQQMRQPFQAQPQERMETQPATEITVEEIIEAIIAERWKDFEARLESFEKRDIQLHNEIEALSKRIAGFENVLQEKEKTMLSKLDEFGESMTGIEGRIGSIERVFKDFLPELTTNIRTMSDLVERMKKEKESN